MNTPINPGSSTHWTQTRRQFPWFIWGFITTLAGHWKT